MSALAPIKRLLRSKGLASRILMAVSILTRLGMGMAVFVVLARTLGPEEFGLVSTVFAYATLGGLMTDFGFGMKTLREIANRPEGGKGFLLEALTVKVALTVLTVAVGAAVSLFLLPFRLEDRLACALFASGILIATVGDLAMVAYRALGRYAGEARIVLWTSGFYGVVVSAVALSGAGVAWVGVAFLVCRAIFAVVAITSAIRLFPGVSAERPRGGAELLRSMRSSLSWAADNGMGYLTGQVDGIIIPHMLGLTEAGIYQAGARFVQAGLALVGVLSNIHIPGLAAARTPAEIRRRQTLLFLEFTALGAVFGLVFALLGPWGGAKLLGHRYDAVAPLWRGFGAFVLARYAAAGLGASLTAHARPGLRVAGQMAGVITIIAGMALFLPSHGLNAAPWVMAGGAAATSIVYGLGLVRVDINAEKKTA